MSTASPRKHGTLKDIAAHTGLSVSTVSRALANNPVIPDRTREIVQKAAKELRYRPNALAKALRTRRTNTIGVLVPDIRNAFCASLATEIQAQAHAKGFSILLQHLGEDVTQIDRYLDILVSHQVEGIIAVPEIHDADLINQIIDHGVPLVTIGHTTFTGIPAISVDPTRGISQALAHLCSLPNSRIGFVAGPDSETASASRLQAVLDVAAQLNCTVEVASSGLSFDGGKRACGVLLEKGVNAILCADAVSTIGALASIREAGLEVGKDVALIGFEHCDLFEVYTPPIATVDQHIHQISAAAFAQIHSLIQSARAQSEQIETSFIMRASAALQ